MFVVTGVTAQTVTPRTCRCLQAVSHKRSDICNDFLSKKQAASSDAEAHQSTVPPASASILRNSWLTWRLRIQGGEARRLHESV